MIRTCWYVGLLFGTLAACDAKPHGPVPSLDAPPIPQSARPQSEPTARRSRVPVGPPRQQAPRSQQSVHATEEEKPIALGSRSIVVRRGSYGGSGTSLEFPARRPEDPFRRIIEQDRADLQVLHRQDAGEVWLRRSFDNGAVRVNRFSVAPAHRHLAPQFVDAVFEPRDIARHGPNGSEPTELGRVFVTNEPQTAVWESFLEVWLFDAQNERALQPFTRRWFPIVAARPGADPTRLGWNLFAVQCRGYPDGCVIYGTPKAVCEAYERLAIGDRPYNPFYIWPQECT